MMKNNVILTLGIAGAILLTSCALLSPAKPTATITAPPSGTQVDANTEIQVQVAANDAQGVTRIDLFANGVVVATEPSPNPSGQPFFVAVLRYTPKSPGTQTLEARAYNTKGTASDPAAINLLVRDAQVVAPGVPQSFPTLTPLPNATATSTTAAPPPPQPQPQPQPAITFVLPTAEPPPQQQPTVATAPAAPNNFVATGIGTTIKFTWNDNSLNENGFRIYQVGTVAPVITQGAHAATGGMAYDWAGRPCNTSNTFYIRAFNDAGESASSGTNSAVTIPCAPTGFSATGASQSSVNVAFTDNATNEQGYRVYRNAAPAVVVENLPAHLFTGATNGVVNPVICGQSYDYFVRAWNAAGESPSSNMDSGATNACTIKVTIKSVHILNDGNPSGAGNIKFSATVHGQNKDFSVTANSGETKNVSVQFTLSLSRGTNFTVSVTGVELGANPIINPPTPLGTAIQTYSSADANWKEGNNRCDQSASPHYFDVCYDIEVTP